MSSPEPKKNAPRSRKAEQSDQTRKALLRAARTLFAAKGYADTSIEEVARRAGLSKGALYHHFRDKTALFDAVVAKQVRTMGKAAQRISREEVQRTGGERHGWARLAAGVGPFLEQLSEPATRRIVLVDGPAVLGRKRFDEVWVENSLLIVRRALSGGDQAIGVAPHRIDPLARVLLGGLQEAVHTIQKSPDPDRARAELTDAILWLFWALHRQARDDALAAQGAAPAELARS
jgi:AcrR family transcriptional regulator